MKKANPFPCVKLVAAAALSVFTICPLGTALYAQAPTGPDTSTSTTEDSTGKVTAISPGTSISVTSRRGPFTYRLGEDLHVIGPDAKPIKITEVQAGQEVTVFYYLRNGNPTVSRIVVLKSEAGKKESK